MCLGSKSIVKRIGEYIKHLWSSHYNDITLLRPIVLFYIVVCSPFSNIIRKQTWRPQKME